MSLNFEQVNATQPVDWNPSREEIEQVKRAVANEAYPPAGRSGVGTVLRRG